MSVDSEDRHTDSPTDREKAGLAIIEQLGWGQILQTIPYAGLPRALSAMALLRKIQQGAPLEL